MNYTQRFSSIASVRLVLLCICIILGTTQSIYAQEGGNSSLEEAEYENIAPEESSPYEGEPTRISDKSTDSRIASSGTYCDIQTNYPHQSSHVSGMINVTGKTTCSANMPWMKISVKLYKGANCWGNSCSYWIPVGTDGSNTRHWKNKVEANSHTSCEDGIYLGKSIHEGTYPSGNTFYEETANYPAIEINCG